ncbi:MAG: hypothetical protein QNJ00_16970 [Woeseiaceae bacterium]|nr:hypothetical protein [Woeseiaceae bacterium]
MKLSSCFAILVLLASPLAVAQEPASANVDDTANIDTESSMDVAEQRRRFTVSGDLRPLVNFADIDFRSGNGASDRLGLLRYRAKASFEFIEGIQVAGRVAGRCSTDDCGADWVWDRAKPTSVGLAQGQATFDELYVHFFRRERFNITIGRQQTRFVLRGGVFARSLDRVDSNNTNVTWTDGLHARFFPAKGWTAHVVVQQNASDGTGSIRRGPLDFSTSAARQTYFVAFENTNTLGPIVQRALDVSFLPDSLLVDGDLSGRREDYWGVVGRLVGRWPQRADGVRLRAGVEVGYAPERPTADALGLQSSASGLAWNVVASLMDVVPNHSIAINYAQTGGGWLLSPQFGRNEEQFELRYQWRPAKWPMFEARIRWREDLEPVTDGLRDLRVFDAFVRLTWQFGG